VLQVTNNKSYPESLVLSVSLKGLNPEIKQIVMPQNHTIEALRKASNLAEKTVAVTDNTAIVAAAFSDIATKQIRQITKKLAQLEQQPKQTWSDDDGRSKEQRDRQENR
jgi:translation initiation factor 6 (eIF-6)